MASESVFVKQQAAIDSVKAAKFDVFSKPETAKTMYTKQQINDILNLEGWLYTQIDVFNLYAVLTIGVTNNTCGPGDSWEIKQKTYSEKALDIKLEDFAECTSKAAVKKQFKKIMAKAVSNAMFPGNKVW
jgi:hypothetical protein